MRAALGESISEKETSSEEENNLEEESASEDNSTPLPKKHQVQLLSRAQVS